MSWVLNQFFRSDVSFGISVFLSVLMLLEGSSLFCIGQSSPTNEVLFQFDFPNQDTNDLTYVSNGNQFMVLRGTNTPLGLDLGSGFIILSTNTFQKISSYFSLYLVAMISCDATNEVVSRLFSTNYVDSINVYYQTNKHDTNPMFALYVIRENELVFLKRTKVRYMQFVLRCYKHYGINDVYINGKSVTKVFADPIAGMAYPGWFYNFTVPLTNFIRFGTEDHPFPGKMISLKMFNGTLTSEQILDICSPNDLSIRLNKRQIQNGYSWDVLYEIDWFFWPYLRIQTSSNLVRWSSMTNWTGVIKDKHLLCYSFSLPVITGFAGFNKALVLYPNPISEDTL